MLFPDRPSGNPLPGPDPSLALGEFSLPPRAFARRWARAQLLLAMVAGFVLALLVHFGLWFFGERSHHLPRDGDRYYVRSLGGDYEVAAATAADSTLGREEAVNLLSSLIVQKKVVLTCEPYPGDGPALLLVLRLPEATEEDMDQVYAVLKRGIRNRRSP
jgi:hypothetical protein